MNTKRAIIFLAALIFLTTAVQATDTNYNINLLGQPHDYAQVSPNSTSYQFVNLTYDGTPVEEENLEADDGIFFYNYPASGSDNVTLEHFDGALWLAKVDTNTSTYDINYTVKNVSEESLHIWAEESDTLSVSEMDVEKVTSINDPVKAGKTITFRADLTNTTSGNQLSNANVDIRFVNGTYSTETVNIGYNEEDNLYRTSLDIPDYTDQTFIGQLIAEKDGQTTTSSFKIHTKMAIDGYIDYIQPVNGGCRSSETTAECEGGAQVETGFNVTDDAAESVNLTIIKHRNDGTEEVHEEISLNRDGSTAEGEPGYYTGEFEFPYINRSKYQNDVKLMFNASSDNRVHIVNHTVTYRSFRANIDLERGYAYQDGEFEIPLTLERYFTLDTILEEDIKALDVNITDPNGEMFESYNLSNVSLDSDEQYSETIQIPGNATTGDYQIDLFIEDIYNANKTLVREFSVRETDRTFDLGTDSITQSFDRAGQYSSNIDVTDVTDTGVNISTEVSDDLEEVVDISDNFQVAAGETSSVGIDWNFSKVQSYSGYIRFEDVDSSYNRTVDVEIEAPDCVIQSGPLCSLTEQEIEYTMDERTSEVYDIELRNVGEEGSIVDVSTDLTGNITEALSVEEVESFETSQTVPLNFTPEESGTFTGTLTVSDSEDNSLEYDVTLDSNVPSGAAQADITESINLGSLVSGESASAEIDIENTGETIIENISLSSSDYSIEADTEGLSVEPGNTITLPVDFSNVESESGEIEITLEAIEESTETVSVSADVYSDYGERIDTLFDDIQNLRDETGDQQALSTLDEAETQLDSAEISWENGDYQEAVDSYEQADEIYSEAQSTVESQQQEEESGSEDPGTGDPGTQEPADEGGLPIIPIVAVIFILIVGGFVFIESYIPEEGDPLYDVLGQ